MGSISDLLKKAGVSEKVSQGISTAESILSVIPAISTYYTTIKTALDFLGISKNSSDLQKAVDQILSEMNRGIETVLGFEIASDACERMREVAQLSDLAKNQVVRIHENPDLGDEIINEIDSNSLNAATYLGNLSMFNRPFYKEAVYSDSWSGVKYPPGIEGKGSEEVFDYRVPLPAFLEAITCRLIVIETIIINKYIKDKISNLQEVQDKIKLYRCELYGAEIDGYAENLYVYYKMIKVAIVEMRRPDIYDIFGRWGASSSFGIEWDDYYLMVGPSFIGRTYGAVELYSGLNSINKWDDYYDDYQVGLKLASENAHRERHQNIYYNKFLPKYVFRILKHQKNLYCEIGLPAILRMINQLKTLAGEDPVDAADFSIWSLREVSDLVYKEISKAPTPIVMRREISLRDLMSILEIKKEYSLRRMFEEC